MYCRVGGEPQRGDQRAARAALARALYAAAAEVRHSLAAKRTTGIELNLGYPETCTKHVIFIIAYSGNEL